jgi:hypothetical protein
MVDSRSFLLNLIMEYIACSKFMCGLLLENYNTDGETLLRARRINLIPQLGEIEGGVKFNFHGGGCFFEFDNGTIDIDFGPAGRCDGFDEFRLYDFLKNTKSHMYKELLNEEVFKSQFQILIKEKIIVAPEWYPNPHLYYLAESV